MLSVDTSVAGGAVLITSSVSTNAASGDVKLSTPTAGTNGMSGKLVFSSGVSTAGGNSGSISIGSGTTAVGGKGGAISITVCSGNNGAGCDLKVMAGDTTATASIEKNESVGFY